MRSSRVYIWRVLEPAYFLGVPSRCGRPADTGLAPELAREICQRNRAAALLEGSIHSLGASYVLGLRAENCSSGKVLDEEQIQVSKKEEVLSALSQIATRFRKRTGESLASVEKYSLPLEEATTNSLEALQLYSRGVKVAFTSGFGAAIPLMQRAIEIDPRFALAYSHLGLFYSAIGTAYSGGVEHHQHRAMEGSARGIDQSCHFLPAENGWQVTGSFRIRSIGTVPGLFERLDVEKTQRRQTLRYGAR